MTDLLLIIILAANCTTIAILLHKTDFIFEYLNFLILNPKWRMNLLWGPYNKSKADYTNYLYYLREKWVEKPILSFLLHLALCPYCLGVWTAVGTSLFVWRLDLVGVVYILSLFMYFLLEKFGKSK